MNEPQAGGLDAIFAAEMGRLLGPDFPTEIALAVSGGGDSMAMLGLAHGWARVMGTRLSVVTIDHGLRPESADEAAMVAAECATLGHPHSTLHWHWDGQGNVQDRARAARLALIDGWRGAIRHVLIAHTQDDVAETFLMRLARGSGVEGLSAMADQREVRPLNQAPGRVPGFTVIRPLLEVARADLRHYADTLKIPYVDDPSNADPRFDRVKARQTLAALAPLGITQKTLSKTAQRMARGSTALKARAASVAAEMLRPDHVPTGHVVFDRDAFAAVERDTQLRLLAAALQWVADAPYRPRASALEAVLERALAGGGGTLHGGQTYVTASHLRIFREFAAVDGQEADTGPNARWDGLWALSGPAIEGLKIRPLGPDGWRQVSEKPSETPPYETMLSTPAVFDGNRLVASTPLQFGPAYELQRYGPAKSFTEFLQLR